MNGSSIIIAACAAGSPGIIMLCQHSAPERALSDLMSQSFMSLVIKDTTGQSFETFYVFTTILYTTLLVATGMNPSYLGVP